MCGRTNKSNCGPPPASISNSQTTTEIGARHRLEPLAQGGLDGLCGLYDAVNALRLALADDAPLTQPRCKALFAEGINYLHRKRGLDAAVVHGMGLQRRLALTRHLAKLVSTTNCQFVVERPVTPLLSMEDVFAWVEDSLAGGLPVLITLTGGLEHHTVVAGVTSKTLLLFDSGGQRFLRKSSCGLRSGYYQIPPNSLFRIAVHRSG